MERWDMQRATLSKTAMIINYTVRILKSSGEPVSLGWVIYYIRETSLLSRAKNPSAFVSAVLGSELKRKHPRIKRISRGVYDLAER